MGARQAQTPPTGTRPKKTVQIIPVPPRTRVDYLFNIFSLETRNHDRLPFFALQDMADGDFLPVDNPTLVQSQGALDERDRPSCRI